MRMRLEIDALTREVTRALSGPDERYTVYPSKKNTLSLVVVFKKLDREKAKMMCKMALWCVKYRSELRSTMTKTMRMLEDKEETVAREPVLINGEPQRWCSVYPKGTGADRIWSRDGVGLRAGEGLTGDSPHHVVGDN